MLGSHAAETTCNSGEAVKLSDLFVFASLSLHMFKRSKHQKPVSDHQLLSCRQHVLLNTLPNLGLPLQ